MGAYFVTTFYFYPKLGDKAMATNTPYIHLTENWVRDTTLLNKAFKSSNIIIIGENHYDKYIEKIFLHCLNEFKPDYFLTEHIQYLTLSNNEEREEYLKLLKQNKVIHNYFSERWVTNLLSYPEIEMIGMDYKAKTQRDFEQVVYEGDLIESFIIREQEMLKNCIEYSKKGKVLVQVGDTHLRTQACVELGEGSPIVDYYKQVKECSIFRPENLTLHNP